ncbi:helix-turn-helix domain-containing protein [Haploplasma axanthum]|nr:helix-turn-helix transcriptional regulator [Haploplasma axanthum]
MTTGEKIAKLRKERNLTQEELADKLNVSRQAVSKWESNITFPETDKIIELSKIFSCSIDYLLLKDISTSMSNDEYSDNSQEKFYNKQGFTTAIYTVCFGILMLLMYLFPILKIKINEPFFPTIGNAFVKVNLYNLLGSISEIGNVIALLAFLTTIAIIAVGVLIYFYPRNKKIFTIRFIMSIVLSSLWLLFLVLFASHAYIGSITVILLFSITNIILLKVIEFNKFITI